MTVSVVVGYTISVVSGRYVWMMNILLLRVDDNNDDIGSAGARCRERKLR